MAAERSQILGRAQRTVEWIVDPAQPEPSRHLSVQGERIGYFVARDEAWRHTVGLGGAGLRQQGGPRAVLGEDAVEDLLAALVEVVVPHAAGEGEPLGHGERRLAERGVLPQIVREGGPEQVVLGRQQSLSEAIGSAQDRRGERVEPRYKQVLGVVALVLAVEAAHEPLDAVSAAGQAQL